MSTLPEFEFKMPACLNHFFKGHKWWCRKCDKVTADQFHEVAEAFWRDEAYWQGDFATDSEATP